MRITLLGCLLLVACTGTIGQDDYGQDLGGGGDPMGGPDAGTITQPDAAPGPTGPGPTAVACDNPVTTTVSGRHNPGTACLDCHKTGGTAPRFTLGGTLYTGVASTTAVAGATIHLVDANNVDVKLVTATNGNFWTTQTIAFPVTTRASKCPDTQAMNAPVTATGANCNMGGCHATGFRVHLP